MPRDLCALLLLVRLTLLLWWAAASDAIAASDIALPSCSTDEEKQFTVTVTTNDPLGLRLSEKLEVLEFVVDTQGRSRAVEVSGLAEIGDRLVRVNNASLVGSSLANAVAALAAAELPKTLRFQTHDGRCLQSVAAAGVSHAADSVVQAETAATAQATTDVVFDYMLLSLGDKDSEKTFFGVLSADGKPSSCSFREVEVAFPFDACAPLSTNSTDKYVIVPSMSGCPAHQKAAFAQDSGAKGVIFVQHEGKKPQQIKLPPEMPKPIALPLVMISMDSGTRVIDQLSRVHPTQTPRIRFVFSEECASDKFQVHPDDDPLAQSVQARTQSAVAGFLTVTTAKSGSAILSAAAFEFLKPSSYASSGDTDDQAKILASTRLPLGKHDLVVPDRAFVRPCATQEAEPGAPSDRSSTRKRTRAVSSSTLATRALQETVQGQWVAVRLQTLCSLSKQLEYFALLRVSGVVFGDDDFPKSGSAQHLLSGAAVPFVVVSLSSLRSIHLGFRRADPVAHFQVEFAGESALRHHWSDLAELGEPLNWPSSEIARDRLFHRVRKDHATVADRDAQLQLARNERYDALIALYWKAQRFYHQASDRDAEHERE
ncbi:hypothetical protein PybrP1_011150 [[Pythium] brassicae (nom. inval.)]|nr:hypothetical protein PybrP1_011150 [[Pythium] brassicae (nom. inval.)]